MPGPQATQPLPDVERLGAAKGYTGHAAFALVVARNVLPESQAAEQAKGDAAMVAQSAPGNCPEPTVQYAMLPQSIVEDKGHETAAVCLSPAHEPG
jgi:hypothetical protein